jgi:glyceraldehyde 3-phosphate dehydrogenase
MTKIGINGFGRIGRLVFRAIVEQGLLGKEVEVVALNDLVPADNLAYLLQYDSTQGHFQGEVTSEKSRPDLPDDDTLVVKVTTSGALVSERDLLRFPGRS